MILKLLRILVRKRRIPIDPVSHALKILSKRKNPFTFLQVGSSDGGLNDSLRLYIEAKGAVGIFVEPIYSSIQSLQQRYSGYNNLYFENCAIDTRSGTRILYQISGDAKALPEWAYQVASFDLQVLLNHSHSIPDVASRIVETTVLCRTLEEIIERHKLKDLDCFQIDTEGHDFEILKGFPFDRFRPRLVIYEHKHLTESALKSSIVFLESFGYSIVVANADVIAEAM